MACWPDDSGSWPRTFTATRQMAGSQTSRFKVVLEDGLATVIPFLKAVNQASNVFPPLQSATGIAIAIGEAVQVIYKDFSHNHLPIFTQSYRSLDRTGKIGPTSANLCKMP